MEVEGLGWEGESHKDWAPSVPKGIVGWFFWIRDALEYVTMYMG